MPSTLPQQGTPAKPKPAAPRAATEDELRVLFSSIDTALQAMYLKLREAFETNGEGTD